MSTNGVVTKAEITRWTEEALLALQEAQQLCSDAHQILQAISYTLTILLPDKIEYVEFLISNVRQQRTRVAGIVQQIQQRVNNDLGATFDQKWQSQLVPGLEELDNILAKLNDTRIPQCILDPAIRDTTDTHERNLTDFVSIDAIEQLKENIAVYETRTRLIHKMLKSRLAQDVLTPFQKLQKLVVLALEQLDALEALLYELTRTTGFARNVLKENASLEQELGSLLEMLTKHYDQCLQGKQLFSNSRAGTAIAIDSEILRDDSLAVPNVVEELRTLHGMVVRNNDRTTKFKDSRLTCLSSDLLVEYLDRLRKYQATNIVQYLQLLHISEKELLVSSVLLESTENAPHPLEMYISMVGDLIFHYNKFYHIYKTKYLSELHNEQYVFPRKFFRLLTEFFENDMHKLQAEETERRRKWLAKYGDFIPKEFWLPGEQNQPHVVQVITDGIDETELADGLEEEKNLLRLIRQMKDMV